MLLCFYPAVMKSGNEAYIEVDGVRGIVAEGDQRSSAANTNDPLYFGGLPSKS